MRRLTLYLVAACAVAAPTASVAPAKSDNGVRCALHAKLAAKNETTGSTSTAKGNTLIKVRNDGTIEFKTQINNKNHETFVVVAGDTIRGEAHEATRSLAGHFGAYGRGRAVYCQRAH